ncbi:MAG: hypothetical protein ACR2RV_23810, partial [Verrucomicrobiales bacterium]
MRSFALLQLLVLSAAHLALAEHQTTVLDEPHVGGSLPYEIELTEISLAPAQLPNIHSAAAACWRGRWIILAGRTNGLHGLTGNNAFDPAFESREIWVIDPGSRESWHKSLEDSPASGLNQDQVDSLSSVNTQFFQDGDTLFVVGGYGYQRSAADHVTYDRLSAIDLPGIIGWVMAPAGTEADLASDHIQQISDSFFQVTGGGLGRIGDEYQLVFGQNYAGRYRPHFNGTYTQCVRRFEIDRSDGSLSVPASSKIQTPQAAEFRRRDLNVLKILEPGANVGELGEAVLALSGVFTPSDGVWTVPVIVRAGGEVTMLPPQDAETLQQGFQIYHCAKAALFHRATGEVHTILFGGITVLEHDDASFDWTQDDRAPFTNQCGVIVRHGDGRFEQFLLSTRFPEILSDGKELRFGANAEFFPNPDAPSLGESIFDLAAIDGPLVLGHIFGGLVADAGNGGNTGSSGRVFEVRLTPIVPEPQPLEIHAFPPPVNLQIAGEAGAAYLLEHSSDLSVWQPASPPQNGDGSPIRWSIDEPS